MHEKINTEFISKISKEIGEAYSLFFLPRHVKDVISHQTNTVSKIEHEIAMLKTVGISVEEINVLLEDLRDKAYQQYGSNMEFIITGLKEYRIKIEKQKIKLK